jgi:hypothetical protein
MNDYSRDELLADRLRHLVVFIDAAKRMVDEALELLEPKEGDRDE